MVERRYQQMAREPSPRRARRQGQVAVWWVRRQAPGRELVRWSRRQAWCAERR
jgi:hypothetical protein